MLHGTWVADGGPNFDNRGKFGVWLELYGDENSPAGIHPAHFSKHSSLADLTIKDHVVSDVVNAYADTQGTVLYASLPTQAERPLPSLEISHLTGEAIPKDCDWQTWEMRVIHITEPLKFLRDLRFAAGFGQSQVRLSGVINFWVQYAQQLRNLIRQDQYLPAMKCHQSGKRGSQPIVHAGWQPAGELYERSLKEFAVCMPGLCAAVSSAKPKRGAAGETDVFSAEEILRHFSEQQVNEIVSATPMTAQILNQAEGSWLSAALAGRPQKAGARRADRADCDATLEDWKQWRLWQREITGRNPAGSQR